MSIIPFVSVIGAPVGIASASFSPIFSVTTGIIKKLQQEIKSITRNKKKKHNKIFMLAKSKLKCIETLISQALIDLEISHEEFKIIVNEKEKHENMKEIVRMIKSNDKLNENNKNIGENNGNA